MLLHRFNADPDLSQETRSKLLKVVSTFLTCCDLIGRPMSSVFKGLHDLLDSKVLALIGPLLFSQPDALFAIPLRLACLEGLGALLVLIDFYVFAIAGLPTDIEALIRVRRFSMFAQLECFLSRQQVVLISLIRTLVSKFGVVPIWMTIFVIRFVIVDGLLEQTIETFII